jgi:hypothetical protein
LQLLHVRVMLGVPCAVMPSTAMSQLTQLGCSGRQSQAEPASATPLAVT